MKAVLQAMKTHGMIVADNGSDWSISGAPNSRWNNDRLVSELASVKGSSFEVVRMDGLTGYPVTLPEIRTPAGAEIVPLLSRVADR